MRKEDLGPVGVYKGCEIRTDFIQFQYVYDPSGKPIQIFDKTDGFEKIINFLDNYKRQLKSEKKCKI